MLRHCCTIQTKGGKKNRSLLCNAVAPVRVGACYRIELPFSAIANVQRPLFTKANILFYVHGLCTLQIGGGLLFVLRPRNVNETHERKCVVDLSLHSSL